MLNLSRSQVADLLNKEKKTFIYATLGCTIFALSVTLFVTPLRLPSAGITGLSLLLKYTLNVPLWASNLVLNGLLFGTSWKLLPKRFSFWTAYTTLLLSLLYPLCELVPAPQIGDPLVVALIGGVVQGLSLAMCFSVGASMGGTDIAAVAIKRLNGMEIGTVSMVLNFAVIALFWPITSLELMTYAVVMTYLKGVVTNNDIRSFATRKEALILPVNAELVKDFIVYELGRGVTVFDAHGGFDCREHNVFLTLLTPRQAVRLKLFLRDHDPNAFLRIGEVTEVLGRGFGSLHRDL